MRYWKQILRWAFVAFLLGVMGWHISRNVDQYEQTMALVGWQDITLLVVLGIVSSVLYALRNKLVVDRLSRHPVPLFSWLRVFIISRLLNQFMSQAGNAYRAVATKQLYGLSYANYVATFLLLMWIDLLVALLLVCVAIGANQYAMAGTKLPDYALPIALAVFLAVVAAAPVGTWIARPILRTVQALPKLRERLLVLLDGFWRCAGDGRMLVQFTGFEVLLVVIAIINLKIAFAAIGMDLQVYQTAIILMIVKASVIVVLTPGNLGVREAALVGAASLFDIDVTQALSVALITRASEYIMLTVMGLPAVLATTRASPAAPASGPRGKE